MKYFAYGSNMSLLRLRERVPSAERIGVFVLEAHQLRFHKSSNDGSGKCDAYQTDNSSDLVIGAIFEIKQSEKPALDKAEGLGYGYREKIVRVKNDSGDLVEAFTYYATRIEPSLLPYSWYLNHVIVGAQELNVPKQYLYIIESTVTIDDHNSNRDAAQRAIYD